MDTELSILWYTQRFDRSGRGEPDDSGSEMCSTLSVCDLGFFVRIGGSVTVEVGFI